MQEAALPWFNNVSKFPAYSSSCIVIPVLILIAYVTPCVVVKYLNLPFMWSFSIDEANSQICMVKMNATL